MKGMAEGLYSELPLCSDPGSMGDGLLFEHKNQLPRDVHRDVATFHSNCRKEDNVDMFYSQDSGRF